MSQRQELMHRTCASRPASSAVGARRSEGTGHSRLPRRSLTAPVNLERWLTDELVIWIRCYQLTMPLCIRHVCRHTPCCSEYAIAALRKYGLLSGIARSVLRILRCVPPFSGIDFP